MYSLSKHNIVNFTFMYSADTFFQSNLCSIEKKCICENIKLYKWYDYHYVILYNFENESHIYMWMSLPKLCTVCMAVVSLSSMKNKTFYSNSESIYIEPRKCAKSASFIINHWIAVSYFSLWRSQKVQLYAMNLS